MKSTVLATAVAAALGDAPEARVYRRFDFSALAPSRRRGALDLAVRQASDNWMEAAVLPAYQRIILGALAQWHLLGAQAKKWAAAEK